MTIEMFNYSGCTTLYTNLDTNFSYDHAYDLDGKIRGECFVVVEVKYSVGENAKLVVEFLRRNNVVIIVSCILNPKKLRKVGSWYFLCSQS